MSKWPANSYYNRRIKTPKHFSSAFFCTLGTVYSILFFTELRPKIVPVDEIEGASPKLRVRAVEFKNVSHHFLVLLLCFFRLVSAGDHHVHAFKDLVDAQRLGLIR